MKKLLLVAVFALFAFSLTACFGPKPELDLENVEDALEDDYSVRYTDDEDYLGPNVVAQLQAYEEDVDDDEYANFLYMQEFKDSKSAKLAVKLIELQIEQQIDNVKVEIEAVELQIKTITYVLEEYEDDMEDEMVDEYEDELDDLEDELEDLQEKLEHYKTISVGRKGNVAWYGTEEAIEASKK